MLDRERVEGEILAQSPLRYRRWQRSVIIRWVCQWVGVSNLLSCNRWVTGGYGYPGA